MAKLDLRKAFEDITFDTPEQMLGKGAMMPFNGSNSGSRKLMFGTHLEQRLTLCNPEVPYIETGHEMEFGKYSSSFMIADRDYEVYDKVYKFDQDPGVFFYLICIDHEDKKICVFEKKLYKHVTESYGYIYSDESGINHAEPGTTISKGSVIAKSKSFDENNNRQDGRNLLSMFCACEESMEDAIIISESASKALASPLIKKVTVQINDNEIPLNLYGNDQNYKIFPDIGEETEHNILCGMRIERKEESLYSLSYPRLRELMISDEKYSVSGKVVDIDVYCNAPDKFIDNPYYGQIEKYYNSQQEMYRKIVDDIEFGHIADLIEDGYVLDYDMQKLYYKAKGDITGQRYYANGKAFSNIIMEITLVEEIPVRDGDKLTNRYGGKGVVSRIKPDNEMPRDEYGRVIDILLNMCGVVGRENPGQLFELSISHVCMKIAEFFRLNVLQVDECIDMYLRLLEIVSPSMYDWYSTWLGDLPDDMAIMFIANIMDDSSIYLAIEPMSENMSIQKISELYKEFPFAKPRYLYMPLRDSMGNIRHVKSRRPIVYGYLYYYRLKQYAEEKFSVTSLSSTNTKNENTRNKASSNYKALYPRTPIRFGEMEIGNMIHMGADLVSQILMIYSTSPLARELCKEIQTGDPFNIDIRLDMDSKNRNAEILNVRLKTKGLKLVFRKRKKVKEKPLLFQPLGFLADPRDGKPIENPLIFHDHGEKFNLEEAIESLKRSRDIKHPLVFYPLEFIGVEEDKE